MNPKPKLTQEELKKVRQANYKKYTNKIYKETFLFDDNNNGSVIRNAPITDNKISTAENTR